MVTKSVLRSEKSRSIFRFSGPETEVYLTRREADLVIT